jgi:hypothetical protein
VDLPKGKPCTPEQMDALRLVMQESLSMRLKSEVATDHCDMTLAQCYQCAESGKDGFTLGFHKKENEYDD